jgi:hypothetical protein
MIARKKYIIFGIFALLVVSGYVVYQYMYREHRDIASEKVDFELQPQQLMEVMSDAAKALKYTDKVIQTSGKITSVEQNSVILDHKTQVNFKTADVNPLNVGNDVIIKGRCVGYDDLLELVKIDQATIIN